MAALFKTCFKCNKFLAITEFYIHKMMVDGRLNKCKECAKHDVNQRYYKKPEFVRGYEQRRAKDPVRKAKVSFYQRTRRAKYPEKDKARNMVGNFKRDGKLNQQPCEVCGDNKSQAHHTDYNQPLKVNWLCFRHHREIGHNQIVM